MDSRESWEVLGYQIFGLFSLATLKLLGTDEAPLDHLNSPYSYPNSLIKYGTAGLTFPISVGSFSSPGHWYV